MLSFESILKVCHPVVPGSGGTFKRQKLLEDCRSRGLSLKGDCGTQVTLLPVTSLCCSRTAWLQAPSLPCTSSMTLGALWSLSEDVQLYHLWKSIQGEGWSTRSPGSSLSSSTQMPAIAMVSGDRDLTGWAGSR